LADELLEDESVRSAFLNLPFGVVAVGLVVRGFAGYFLERGGVLGPAQVPALSFGPISVAPFALATLERLALFVAASLAVSVCGILVVSYITDREAVGELSSP
jgi:putative membrane protein